MLMYNEYLYEFINMIIWNSSKMLRRLSPALENLSGADSPSPEERWAVWRVLLKIAHHLWLILKSVKLHCYLFLETSKGILKN